MLVSGLDTAYDTHVLAICSLTEPELVFLRLVDEDPTRGDGVLRQVYHKSRLAEVLATYELTSFPVHSEYQLRYCYMVHQCRLE